MTLKGMVDKIKLQNRLRNIKDKMQNVHITG